MASSSADALGVDDTLTLKGFVSYVEMQDGRGDWKRAKVYKKVAEGSKITCYIASTAGVQYRIAWKNDNLDRTGAAGFYYVDGKCLQSYIVGKQEPRGRLALCEGNRIGRTTVQPLFFGAPLTIDIEDEACTDDRIYQNMGIISIKLLRINMAMKAAPTNPLKPKAFAEQDTLLETRKKAIAHITKFGAQTFETAPCTYPKYTNIDSEAMPYVHFEFIYRSRNYLEAIGTIPTTSIDDASDLRSPPPRDINAREDADRRMDTIEYEI